MYVEFFVEGLRANEIGKSVINEVVLHRFRLLYGANIRIFHQNRKMGKSFCIQGNDAPGKDPYLCIRNKNNHRYGSI